MPFIFFFFNDTATTEIYTLSLHDALPILRSPTAKRPLLYCARWPAIERNIARDRKSTRLNSSHTVISYAVFCLKKKTAWLSFSILHSASRFHKLDAKRERAIMCTVDIMNN